MTANKQHPVSPEVLHAAARRPEVIETMRAFYDKADALIAAQPATCWNRGTCCQFGRYGHRLYVTTLEAAYFLAGSDTNDAPPPPAEQDTCPYAYDGRCHARERRPLGCRIFYCDPVAQSWQAPLTEQLLGELRDLHDRLDVPYAYADWLSFLSVIEEPRP